MIHQIPAIKQILLVEDDPQDVKLILAALDEPHLANTIVVVQDGAEALDYLYRVGKYRDRSDENPVLVLLDNNMPKLSGIEVLKTIKTENHLKSIPVVALTSSREPRDLADFYKSGVNAYVVKPVDFSEFMRTVRQLRAFWILVNESPLPARIEHLPLPAA